MLANLIDLGSIPIANPWAKWLLIQAMKQAPKLLPFLEDPVGHVARLGDLIVWNGDGGQFVLGSLESLADSQGRIETAIGKIEQGQLAIEGMLGTVLNLSLATLGITSLSGIFMVHRFRALQKRLDRICSGLEDIQNHLNAQSTGHLRSAVDFLHRYETGSRTEADLRRALEASNYAAHVYAELARHERQYQQRPVLLNHAGRTHCLALHVEVRCLALAGDLQQAHYRLESEEQGILKTARALHHSIADKLGWYLGPELAGQGVTLGILTHFCQQASLAGLLDDWIEDESTLFECLRSGANTAPMSWTLGFGKQGQQMALNNLRYALAAIEEVNRIKSLRLRIRHALDHGYSLSDFETRVAGIGRERDELASDIHLLTFPEPFDATRTERIQSLRENADRLGSADHNQLGCNLFDSESETDWEEAVKLTFRVWRGGFFWGFPLAGWNAIWHSLRWIRLVT